MLVRINDRNRTENDWGGTTREARTPLARVLGGSTAVVGHGIAAETAERCSGLQSTNAPRLHAQSNNRAALTARLGFSM